MTNSPGETLPPGSRLPALLFSLGVVLNASPDFHCAHVHLRGVLQRIALAYLLGALVALHVPRRAQYALGATILAGYWAAMVLVPVPGHGACHLTPDGN